MIREWGRKKETKRKRDKEGGTTVVKSSHPAWSDPTESLCKIGAVGSVWSFYGLHISWSSLVLYRASSQREFLSEVEPKHIIIIIIINSLSLIPFELGDQWVGKGMSLQSLPYVTLLAGHDQRNSCRIYAFNCSGWLERQEIYLLSNIK